MNRYQETIDFLFSQLPMFQRQGATAFKKDLTNITALCKVLSQPQEAFPTIHIAGTNGKGTVAHMLSAVFQAAGFKTGLYTSPHYKDFRERIKINGEYISEVAVVDFVDQQKGHFDEIGPSFFEITVVMAFDYFRNENVDIAIIETGLGGRLDSTNVIKPLCSVITNISFDHQQFLGDTLSAIAGEKAGIIKKSTPVVIGEVIDETEFVFLEKAKTVSAPIYFAKDNFESTIVETRVDEMTFKVDSISTPHQFHFDRLLLNGFGNFQHLNLSTMLTTLKVLKQHTSYDISEVAIRTGLASLKSLTNYKGRWEVLQKSPLVLADSGHNEAGIQLIVNQLNDLEYHKLHIVFGVVKDKEVVKVLNKFPKDAQYYFCKPNVPRGKDVNALLEEAKQAGIHGESFGSVSLALDAAVANAGEKDLVFVGGSTFVVAEVV